jgi:hypothetical protein
MKLLILAGPRGTGETEAVKAVLKSLSLDAHHLSCPGRPWRLYQDLYRHANHAVAGQRYRIVVLNETRAMLNDPRSLDLLKLATEQAEVNRVQWDYSTPAEIRSGEVSAAFDTTDFGLGNGIVKEG